MAAQRAFLYLTTSLALTAAVPVWAQQSDEVAVTLDTIQLTTSAEGTASPAPQTHIGSEAIQHSQGGSLTEVLETTPGVFGSNGDNLLTARPGIRGFGGGKHMSNDPNVVVAIDGVSGDGGRIYQNASGMVADPALLKSIDVLKGPLASLAYGSGIAGGTISARTVDASDLTEGKTGFRFRQLLGANSNGDGWVTSSTLAWQPNEDLEFLANYSRRRLDEQENGRGEAIDLQGYNLPSMLLKGRWTFGDAREHSLSFSHSRTKTAERDVPYGQATGSLAFGNVNRDRDGQITTVAWNWKPADNALVDLELQYSHSKQDTDIEFLPGSFFGGMFGGKYNLDTDRLTLKNVARFQTGSVSHRVTAGLDFSRQTRDEATVLNPAGKIRRSGVFAIDDMDFGNGLTVTGGLRVEHQKIEGDVSDGRGGMVATGPYSTTARTGGLGVSKSFDNGLRAFGSFTYAEGLATLDVLGSRTNLGDLPYADRTEKSRNWEAGVSWSRDNIAGGNAVALQLTAYQTEMWDVNTGVSRGDELTRFKMRGVEALASMRAASGLYARAGATITDNDEQVVSTAGLSDWQDYSYSPADLGFVTIGQQWQNGIDASWTLRGAKSIKINDTESAGWGVHDLKVSYTPESTIFAGATVDFAIDNVFDKQYRDNLSYYDEPGRNVKLSLSKTF